MDNRNVVMHYSFLFQNQGFAKKHINKDKNLIMVLYNFRYYHADIFSILLIF